MELHNIYMYVIKTLYIHVHRKFATFNASSELPSDVQDSLMFWINKVCVTVQQYLDKKVKGQQLLQGDTQQKVGNSPEDSKLVIYTNIYYILDICFKKNEPVASLVSVHHLRPRAGLVGPVSI